MKKVIIIGGGVAGMSAAHELAEREFSVEVYEHKKRYCGGKARSIDVPNTGSDGRMPLPGEHGFRFFPGFYKHVTDTMKRIPTGSKTSAFDNLTPTDTVTIGRGGKKPFKMLVHFPRSIGEARSIVRDLLGADLGLSIEEEEFFGERVWQLMTSCKSRRVNEYENLGWWEFLEADRFSQNYQKLLVEGITRTLVAAKAKTASTKTDGDIFLQLIFNMLDPLQNTDRVLNAPTNQAWLDPWFEHLTKSLGVQYHFNSTAKEIVIKNRQIDSVIIQQSGAPNINVQGDYYIFAIPIEQMAPLVNQEMLNIDVTLSSLKQLAPSVSWMNGLQVYLNQDVKISRGHVICSDSTWALTCISQPQFWPNIDLTKYGDGNIKGIISIDISDWFTPSSNGKRACDCTKEEIFEEVWTQLKTDVNREGEEILTDNMIVAWYLDHDIHGSNKPHQYSVTPGEPGYSINREPLLVNRVSTWDLRPQAYTYIENLFLASDYVKTNTDLATMEGANEAARKAVNAIIRRSGANKTFCKIWDLHEPWFLAPFRWADEKDYKKGLPWNHRKGKLVSSLTAIAHLVVQINSLFNKKIKT